MTRDGTIVRVLPHAGLAYVRDAGSQVLYAFTFDKVQGYCGQSPAAIGLRIGRPVQFFLTSAGISRVIVAGDAMTEHPSARWMDRCAAFIAACWVIMWTWDGDWVQAGFWAVVLVYALYNMGPRRA